MADNTETVTLKLPSGEMVDAVVPAGMPDSAIQSLMRAKHPEFFKSQMPAPNATGIANQALKGTGIQVNAPSNPVVQVSNQMQVPGAITRMMGAAASVAPSLQKAPSAFGQGKSPLLAMEEQQVAQRPTLNAVMDAIQSPINRLGEGDIAGAVGEVGSQLAQGYLLKKAGEAATKAIPATNLEQSPSPINKVLPKSVEELTGTTPQRISELKSFPQKVEGIRKQVISAEQSAHAAASNAFPKFDKPIETGRMIEKPSQGPIGVDDFGEIAPTALEPETTTFKALQEQRSNILKSIAAEKRAINAGMKPRFDLEDLVGKLNEVDGIMDKAALEQGGQAGLDQLNTARVQYGKYMNDFHNTGSPLRKVLDAKPGEVNKIVGQFLNPDNGARAIETLKQYGFDTSEIQSMLGQGDRPLRVLTNESAKLRKAGSDEAYTIQRIKESISQARNNEMPTSAQARLPQSAMSSRPFGILKEVPLLDRLTMRKVTARRLENALKEKVGRK